MQFSAAFPGFKTSMADAMQDLGMVGSVNAANLMSRRILSEADGHPGYVPWLGLSLSGICRLLEFLVTFTGTAPSHPKGTINNSCMYARQTKGSVDLVVQSMD